MKNEGDGATPRGRMTTIAALVRHALTHGTRAPAPWRAVASTDGWCDALTSQAYNKHVRLPFARSHERLARQDTLYDVCLITDHNQTPRVRGKGSAIFIHVARPGLLPTEGCLAFPGAAFRRGRVPAGPYLVDCHPRPVRR